MGSALQLLHTYDYSASPFATGQAPNAKVHGKPGYATQADYGERLELFQPAMKQVYMEPNVGGRLRTQRDTPYIEMPWAQFETPRNFALDFVPVNQFGIHRGFDVPEVNAFHNPIAGDALMLDAMLNPPIHKAEERNPLHDPTNEMIEAYGQHCTYKTLENRMKSMLDNGFGPEVTRKAMDDMEYKAALKHASHPLHPMNIKSVLATSFVMAQ